MLTKRLFLIFLCLLMGLVACKDEGIPTPTAVAPVPTATLAADSAVEAIATLLQGSQGVAVEIVEPRDQGVFAASAWLLTVADQTVFVYEYPDEAQQAAEAAKIAPDGYAVDGRPVAWPPARRTNRRRLPHRRARPPEPPP